MWGSPSLWSGVRWRSSNGFFRSSRAGSCLRPLSPAPFPFPVLSFGKMSDTAAANAPGLYSKPQEDLPDAYGPPSNFLEIDIFNPQTVGVGCTRFTHLRDLHVNKTTCFQTEGVLCMTVLQ